MLRRTEYDVILKTLQAWTDGVSKPKAAYKHHQKYVVVPGTESTALRFKKTGQKMAVYEDAFDIMFQTHQALGHSRDDRKNKVEIEKEFYGITEGCINLFISICPKCIPNSQPIMAAKRAPLKFILSATIGVRAQMDLIDMTSHETKKGFKWVFEVC